MSARIRTVISILRVLLAVIVFGSLSNLARSIELDLPDIQGELQRSAKGLQDQLARLDTAIKTAKVKLKDVETIRAQPEALDEVFNAFKAQIINVLNGVGPNSDLADAIYRAKIAATRLLAWYKRQPADYPERDRFISDLEAQIQRFDDLSQAIQQQYGEAFLVMTKIAQYYSWFKQAVKAAQVADAVASLENVVGELSKLNERLKGVAEKIAPVAPPAPQEQ